MSEFLKVGNFDNSPTKIKGFIDEENCNILFDRCRNELIWKTIWNNDNTSKFIFRYLDNNQILFLEELFSLIEQQLNVEILGLWADFYVDHNNYSDYHKYGIDSDFLILTLGDDRIINFKNNSNSQTFKMENGDLLYFNSDTNKNYDVSVPLIIGGDYDSKYNQNSVHLIFFISQKLI